MSHVGMYRTKIVNPNVETLRSVFESLARQYGAVVTNEITDYYGRKREVMFGLRFQDGKSIGVSLRNGELVVIGDPYGWGQRFSEIRQKIVQSYIHFALLMELQNRGYQLQNVGEREGVIVGEVVRV